MRGSHPSTNGMSCPEGRLSEPGVTGVIVLYLFHTRPTDHCLEKQAVLIVRGGTADTQHSKEMAWDKETDRGLNPAHKEPYGVGPNTSMAIWNKCTQ